MKAVEKSYKATKNTRRRIFNYIRQMIPNFGSKISKGIVAILNWRKIWKCEGIFVSHICNPNPNPNPTPNPNPNPNPNPSPNPKRLVMWVLLPAFQKYSVKYSASASMSEENTNC